MSKHTSEPWYGEARRINVGTPQHRQGMIKGNGGAAFIAETPQWVDGSKESAEREANLDRIVACVNACAGIPTEQLEAGCVGKLIDALLVMRQANSDAAMTGYGGTDELETLFETNGRATLALAPFQKDKPNGM